MSKPVKAAGAENPGAAEMSFEEAIKKLHSVVEAMESDDLPLESLLTHYEEGVRLHQLCRERLAAAEVRIQQIEKDASGRLTAKPIEIVSHSKI
jgi:exodeoxyribonuclease VII small subunit